MNAMLLLKSLEALTFFNRARPHHITQPLSCRRCPEIVSSLVLPARRG
jgi:hypothetical protein